MGVDHHERVFKLGFENTPEYNVAKALFQEFGWVEFLSTFHGFDNQVSLAFARGLKDCTTHVGNIIMEVYEKRISRETGLSTEGERWSKNKTITKEQWQRLLKP